MIQILSAPDKIICAALYLSGVSAKNKMPPKDILLQKFLNDLQSILQEGIMSNSNKINVKMNALVCDAPARADLKKLLVLTHNSYFSCERSIQRGQYGGGHVALLQTNESLRTDDNFLNKDYPDHHKEGTLPSSS